MKKNFGRFISNPIIYYLIMCFIFALGGLILSTSSDYKQELFCEELQNDDIFVYGEDGNRPVMSINRKETQEEYSAYYSDIKAALYYSSFVSNVSQILNNSFAEKDNNNSFTLLKQETFSIRRLEENGGGYYLDDGLYYLYFTYWEDTDPIEMHGVGDYIMSKTESLRPRGNGTSFIYITDLYADTLIEKYDLGHLSKKEAYKEIITNDNYCNIVLRSVIDDNTNYILTINNIIYTDKRTSPRILARYGNFAVVNRNASLNDETVRFEIELKNSAYTIKTVFRTANALGYTVDKCDIFFKQYDKSMDEYVVNNRLSQNYSTIFIDDISESNILLLYFACIVFLAFYSSIFFLSEKTLEKAKIIALALNFAGLFGYSIIGYFLSVYTFFSVLPIISIVISTFYGGMETINVIPAFKKVRSGKIDEKNNDFFCIEI